MSSLDQFAQEKLDDLQRRHLRRALAETVREDGIWVEREGRRLLSFSCNDYLNLTQHPAIKQAAKAAIETYGAGSGASRLVTGNHPLYAQLEARLARIKQTEAAVVFGSGYLANAGIIPVLIGRDGLVLADELSHACLFAGAQLSHGTVITFRHNDVGHARELLERHRAGHDQALIVTDGVFSMDGDLAPLAELLALTNEHDAWLMSDDAHGLGVVLMTGIPVRVRAGKMRQPGLVFMRTENRHRRGKQFWEGADLVVEIVSEGGRSRDLETKRGEYLAFGLLEYWIVDPLKRQVSILYRDGDVGRERTFRDGQPLDSLVLPDFDATPADLWIDVEEDESGETP